MEFKPKKVIYLLSGDRFKYTCKNIHLDSQGHEVNNTYRFNKGVAYLVKNQEDYDELIAQDMFEAYDPEEKEVEVEMNSVSDNPIVDWENKAFLHGGNFHGDYIAAAADQLKMTLVKLSLLSERRINFFFNEHINHFFPPFMNLDTPGLTLGLQGLQFVATSTAAQNQTLAFPHYVHSIPTNGDNQDIVSMGTDAALFLAKVIDNAFVVQAIELITLGQAIDFLERTDKLSDSSKQLYKQLRSVFPTVKEERVLITELPRVVEFLKQSQSSHEY